MIEERRLVGQQLIQAFVELVKLCPIEIPAEPIGQRELLKPIPMQTPLAAGRNQAVRHQRLQNQIPPSALAMGRQAWAQKPSSSSCS